MELPDLLTQTGIATIVVLLIGLVKSAVPNFDHARWGALLACALGVGLAAFANTFAIADMKLEPVAMVLTGLLGGAAAAGVYQAGRSATRSSGGDAQG